MYTHSIHNKEERGGGEREKGANHHVLINIYKSRPGADAK
jgi:hypothetical protein